MNEKKSILIVRLSALGDVAMTVPAVYSLAERYPALDICVLTRPFFAQLFVNRRQNVRIVEADLDGRHRGMRGMFRLLRLLSSYNFDCVADFHNVLRSWVVDAFFMLCGKRVVMVDKQRRMRRKVLSGGGEQMNFVDRYVRVLERLGYPLELTFRSVFQCRMPELPAVVRHPAVGIAPFARYKNKTYPLSQMKKAAEILAGMGASVYLFGGRGKEAEELGRWQNEIGGCVSFAGKCTMADELAIMSGLDVMITMDSANQHLASLAGVKVLSVWGSTTPSCGFLGYGQSKDSLICLNLPCQPCTIAGSDECRLRSFECMAGIEPEDIVQKVKSMIKF